MQAMSTSRPFGSAGVGRWALAGLVLYPLGWIASMLAIATVEQVILEPFGVRSAAGELSLSVRNGVHQAVWGLAVAAVAVPIGRRLVANITFDLTGTTVLAMGLLLAVSTELLHNEFVRARYGMYDAEYAHWAFFAAPAVVASALASWAAMSVPREVRSPLLVLAAAAAVGFGLALLPSIAGLADGLDPASSGLAASLIGGGIFVVLALVIARR